MKTLMRNGRDRRSENPFLGHARKERVSLFGTDQRITSGPAATRLHSKAEYMTAPERFADSQIPLAPRAPSIHAPEGTRVACGGGRAEARGGSASLVGRQWRGVRAGSGGVDCGAENAMGCGKDGLVRTSGRHGEFDPADADGDEGTDLEQLAANGAAGGVSEIGRLQGQTAQAVDENVRHRSKPQTELVGRHGVGRGAVSEQVDLTFLDAVLHLAAGAVDFFV